MELFDLHCDSLVMFADSREDFLSSTRMLHLRELEKYMDRSGSISRVQTMAIFIPDRYRGEAAIRYYEQYRHYFKYLCEKNSDILEQAVTSEDVRRIGSKGKCALILSVESGAGIGGDLSRIPVMAADGVRFMNLVWNGENELASGNDTDHGFSAFGRAAVKEMEKAGIVADVSHLNDRGFYELCDYACKPFMASHSNLRSVCNHPRNLKEDQFQEIVARGGIVGVNLYRAFLSEDADEDVPEHAYVAGSAGKEALWRHIDRMLELGGENTICCGSDFDGAEIDSELNTAEKFAALGDFLLSKGMNEEQIHKFYYGNALRFLSEV